MRMESVAYAMQTALKSIPNHEIFLVHDEFDRVYDIVLKHSATTLSSTTSLHTKTKSTEYVRNSSVAVVAAEHIHNN